jgi:ligand-binding SRPBCC domain-containing protein
MNLHFYTGIMSTEKFKKIFEGLDRAYGQYTPGDIKNGKVGGNAVTKRGFVSDALWEDHLAGKAPSLGSIPIRDDSTCSWGCIDVDTYPLDYKKVISNIRKNNLPLVPCRSKSGGAHLFLFTEEPIAAEDMRNKLMELAGGLGYGDCEIFPKQVELNTTRGDTGSFLNLPYFNSSSTMRYAFLDDGNAASLDQFFDIYDQYKIKKEDFEKIKIKAKKKSANFDGPPCLETLMRDGIDEGGRDNVLYHYSVYAKKKWPDEWEDKIGEFNNKYMNKPLSYKQVDKTIKQHQKTDYQYKCKDQPMCSFCNAPECRKREFGIGGDYEHKFSDLKKYQSENSIWYLTIDAKTVRVNTKQLYNQNLFIEACLDQVNIVLNELPRQEWKRKIQELANNVEVIEMGEDVTLEGRFDQHLHAFVNDQGKAMTLDECNYGKAFEENDRIYFKMEFLLGYLEKQRFRGFDATRVAARLKERDAKSVVKRVEKKNTRLWEIDSLTFKRIDALPLPKEDSSDDDETLPF